MNQTKSYYSSFPQTRLRRLRLHPKMRSLVQETHLSAQDLILPLFIHHDPQHKRAINSMPGHFQLGLEHLATEIEEICALNIPAVILFGIPKAKDGIGTESYSEQGIIQQAIKIIKEIAPNLLVIADSCLCEYTHHGHCGILSSNEAVVAGEMAIDNDATLEILGKQAVSYALSGADVIAPSGMMDGMVIAIRTALDVAGFSNIPILSYAVKYASALYGPFREAAEGLPQFGDRKSYQMNPGNQEEALREVALDLAEGADLIMIKPAGTYLDVIKAVKDAFPGIPLAAYQVSGEFAMIKAAAQQNWIDERKVVLESLLAIKRAGASIIISYFAKEVARWLDE